jgi:hypothetical protein
MRKTQRTVDVTYKRRPRKAKPEDRRCKLTFEEVDNIKDLLSYMKDQEIAKGFPVSHKEINHIRHGRAWAWV